MALKAIKTMAFPRSLSLRWLDIIANFNFTVEYRKAQDHIDVDFLSRCVPRDDNTKGTDEEEDENDVENNAIIIHQITSGVHAIETGNTQTETRSQDQDQPDNITEDLFKQEQNKDEDIQMVKG